MLSCVGFHLLRPSVAVRPVPNPPRCESGGFRCETGKFVFGYTGVESLDVKGACLLKGVSSVAPLPLEPSLEIADHSPDGFNWGYNGSGAAQLALGILYEVIGDAELARSYYPFFKADHVSRWGERWEISESEVRRWLRDVGAGNV